MDAEQPKNYSLLYEEGDAEIPAFQADNSEREKKAQVMKEYEKPVLDYSINDLPSTYARISHLMGEIRRNVEDIRDVPSLRESLLELTKLSFDESRRAVMKNLHAVSTLGALAVKAETAGEWKIMLAACRTLTNLTFGDGEQKAALACDGTFMRALMRLLRPSQGEIIINENTCQVAAGLLRNLSWQATEETKAALRNVAAASAMSQTAVEVTGESCLKSLLSALWNLSAHSEENKADICAVKGFLQFLLRRLKYEPGEGCEILESITGIFKNISRQLTTHPDYASIVSKERAAMKLTFLSTCPNRTVSANARATLRAISNMEEKYATKNRTPCSVVAEMSEMTAAVWPEKEEDAQDILNKHHENLDAAGFRKLEEAYGDGEEDDSFEGLNSDKTRNYGLLFAELDEEAEPMPVVEKVFETPMMFSRHSSLDSLSVVGDVETDAQSIISDVSALTSGLMTPGDVPDSPGRSSPHFPKGGISDGVGNGIGNARKARKELSSILNDISNLSLEEKNVLTACMRVGSKGKRAAVVAVAAAESDDLSPSNSSKIQGCSLTAEETTMLSMCIDDGRGKRGEVKRGKCSNVGGSPGSRTPIRSGAFDYSDSLRNYCTEGTPIYGSHGGSHSDLSALDFLDDDDYDEGGKEKRFAVAVADEEDDELIAEEQQKLLNDCIAAGYQS